MPVTDELEQDNFSGNNLYLYYQEDKEVQHKCFHKFRQVVNNLLNNKHCCEIILSACIKSTNISWCSMSTLRVQITHNVFTTNLQAVIEYARKLAEMFLFSICQ